ncbi:MAG: alpha-amylase family glycosyl hydrolase [Candidatus Acidiferrales bacterium]
MNSHRRNPHLYEINTWAWLDELSRRPGPRVTIGDVPDSEWDNLAELGFDFIWLMGVWERSPESRREFGGDPASFATFQQALPGATMANVVGSPYSVHSYRPDPHIGDWRGLDEARENLNRRGMQLLLDFVPNHLALDHPWTREHPEYFILGSEEDLLREPASFYRVETNSGAKVIARAKDPYFPPWRDVAQLNLFHPTLRAALLAQLVEISKHCDGVRCDMAMLILNDIFAKTWAAYLGGAKAPASEFWRDARPLLPDFTLLAEAYWGTEGRLIELGFNFTYDKGFYDALRNNRPGDLRADLSAEYETQTRQARFLENHDEERSAVVFDGRIAAAATLLSTAPGMRFYQQGQLEGRKIQLPIALSHADVEPVDSDVEILYRALLRLTSNEVFHSGAWRKLDIGPQDDASSENLIAYDWQNEKSWKLIVVNLSDASAQGRVRLGDRIAPGGRYKFYDVLNGPQYLRDADEIRSEGLFVRRDAFEVHLFDVSPA